MVPRPTIKRNAQKNCSNEDVGTVKTSKSIKGRTINTIRNRKGGINILIALKKGKEGCKNEGEKECRSGFLTITAQ